jgi:PAS domain S-box-containing protein
MEESLPRRFGRYHLLDRIDVGGMSEIFAAVVLGEAGFSKRVAIKQIHQRLLTPEYIELFKKEARIAASLVHPNLVEVYDFDRVDDRHYLSMQWVEGVTLEATIQKLLRARKSLPSFLAVHIATELAAGLSYAHTFVGPDGKPTIVVHRDISLSNVLIGFDGIVKLTDFGVAEVLGQAQESGGFVRGKICYMGPELFDGAKATPKSDQYSLGVVLYEMLTMRRLFKRTSDLATISLIKTKDIPPPSSVNIAVPEELDDIVMRALDRNPDERFPSVQEFREALLPFRGEADRTAALGRLMDGLFYRERATRRERFNNALKKALAQTDTDAKPAAAEPHVKKAPDASAKVESQFQGLEGVQKGTILVVDDTEDIRDILTRILRGGGHDVISASTGAEALAVMDNFPVDLILLDVNMPKMSGFQVLEKLRKNLTRIELPVIMVTARNATDDIVKGLSSGANDYVTKPIDFDVLEARIQSHLWLRRAFEAMNRSNEFYRAIVSNATEVVLQLTRALTVVYASPAAWRLLGRSSEELVGTDFLDLIPQPARKMVATQLGQMRAESVSFRMTHPIKMAAHLVTNATTQLRPAFDDAGTWIGFRGAVRVDE